MNKSVVIIEPIGGSGGMNFQNHKLCQSIGKRGWSVSLYSSKTYMHRNENYEAKDFFNNVFGSAPALLRGIKYTYAVLLSSFLIFFKKIPIVHLHLFRVGLKEVILVLIMNIMKKNLVLTAHDVGSFRRNDDIKHGLNFVYSSATKIICHSEQARKALIDLMPELQNKIVMIPLGNFINSLPQNEENSLCKLEKKETKRFKILFFGKIKRIKRLDLMIRALSEIKKRNRIEVEVIIAGKAYDISEDEIIKSIEDLNLEENITFINKHIHDSEINSLFNWADVSILPYDTIFQSGVLLLCMSYKLPTIVSDISGMKEIVKEDFNGVIFKKGSVIDLCKKIEGLAMNPKKLNEIAANSYKYVEAKHSWDLCGKLTSEMYNNILNND